jgi:hypothetical protein
VTSPVKPPIAFIAAALVLLVLPLLTVFGLSALGVVAQSGPDHDGLLLLVFSVWVLVALAVVLILVARVSRRMRS